MKGYKFILIAGGFLGMFGACREELQSPLNEDEAPGQVRDVQVESLPGGAKITYSRPTDKSLLYVKAVYSIREGVEKEVKSSFYNRSLTIDGFPDTLEYEVMLYSVSRGEKESQPVSVKVKPLTPPVIEVFNSLSLEETFGGVSVRFQNDAEANVVLHVVAADDNGELLPAETFYTEREEGVFAARGFDTEERRFGVFVRDRWDNRSDTLFAELAPWFEMELDKDRFREVILPTDTHEGHVGSSLANLWDGELGNGGGAIFHTRPGTGLPQWFTFDLGEPVELSRFKIHHRDGGYDGPYTGGDPRVYEIWGSDDPGTDGEWDNWTLLTTCESVKPSGEPEGTVTTEDHQFAVVDGEDFDFPPGIPPVRYLRFKVLRVWGALDHMYIAELTFWGGVQ